MVMYTDFRFTLGALSSGGVLGLSSKAVLSLLQGIEDRSHKLFIDN